MKLFFITYLASLLLLVGSSENHLTVKKRTLDRAIHKSLNVNDYELEPIKELEDVRGKFFAIRSTYFSQGYLYIGKVESCRIGGCTADGYEEDKIDMMNEYFHYFIILDETLNVKNVKVYDYNATYGYEICSPLWLRNFNGASSDSPVTLGDEIDAISGATISSQAITDDLMARVDLISTFVNNYSYFQE